MTGKRFAIPVLLLALFAAGSLLALDPGQIKPTSATAGVETTYTYAGKGTPSKWCFMEAGAPATEKQCQGSDSTFAFREVGDAYVQVTVDIAGTGAGTVTQKVRVSAP